MKPAPGAVWKRRLLLAALGCVAAMLLIEVSLRIATHSLFVAGGPDSEGYGISDPQLGRIPRPGASMHHPTKGFTANIGEHGIRLNGGPPPAERPLTLAVGDSFAFGDEVDDQDSWPAILERQSGTRVVNGAVPGFGLDQTVLRAEQLAATYTPDTIIVSFIPHDVLRCEMSYWQGKPKPYFTAEDGELRLHPPVEPSPIAYAPLKRLLAHSVTMDLLFPLFLHGEGPAALTVHDRGPEVACDLMARLAALGRARHARIVVLAQPQATEATAEYRQLKDGVLACAAKNGLLTLDLFPVLDALPAEQRPPLFHGHMTAQGNRLVATELMRFLNEAPPVAQ